MDHAVVVGRGLNYANAFEFALKMMETCYVVAERFSSADFLHGPIAMVEASFPVFLFAPSGVTAPSMREMLDKLRSLKAETVVITDAATSGDRPRATRSIVFRTSSPELYTPIPYIIPAQLFAACLAAQKGLDPDNATHLDESHPHNVMYSTPRGSSRPAKICPAMVGHALALSVRSEKIALPPR